MTNVGAVSLTLINFNRGFTLSDPSKTFVLKNIRANYGNRYREKISCELAEKILNNKMKKLLYGKI